ncbi:hypothetical protein [Streptomyces sp. NPDC094032]|uniref:hypothetical protein n=1 Tax=Streptomyces sp. NPDC094032 TaxID=3155308 RepID=UPI003319549C
MIAGLSYRAQFWRNTTAKRFELDPAWVPWSAVDPGLIDFAWDEVEAAEVGTLIASTVPPGDVEWEERFG